MTNRKKKTHIFLNPWIYCYKSMGIFLSDRFRFSRSDSNLFFQHLSSIYTFAKNISLYDLFEESLLKISTFFSLGNKKINFFINKKSTFLPHHSSNFKETPPVIFWFCTPLVHFTLHNTVTSWCMMLRDRPPSISYRDFGIQVCP